MLKVTYASTASEVEKPKSLARRIKKASALLPKQKIKLIKRKSLNLGLSEENLKLNFGPATVSTGRSLTKSTNSTTPINAGINAKKKMYRKCCSPTSAKNSKAKS